MLETEADNNNSWQFSGADYMVVIVPRTFWEFPQLILITAFELITFMSEVGPRRHRQSIFPKVQNQPQDLLPGSLAAEACAKAAHCRKLWCHQVHQSISRLSSWRLRRVTWSRHGWRGGGWHNRDRKPILSFPNSSVFSPKLHWLTLNSEAFKSCLLAPLWDFDFLLLFVTCPFSWLVGQFCDCMEKPSFPVFAAASSPQAAPSCHTDTLSKYDSYRHGCTHKERGSDLREAALGHLEAGRNMTPLEIEFKTKPNKNKDTRFGNGCQVWLVWMNPLQRGNVTNYQLG